MLNAAQEQFGGGNPFAALAQNNTNANSINQQQGMENSEPLPNPWAAPGTNNTSTNTTQNSASTNGGNNTGSGTPGTEALSGLLGSGSGPDFSGSPGMQSYMQQLMGNPELMRQMMSSPMVQNMMQQVSANPALLDQMMNNNPMLRNNPAMREQMRNQVFEIMLCFIGSFYQCRFFS